MRYYTILYLFLLTNFVIAQDDVVVTIPVDLVTILEIAGGDNLQNRVIQQQYQIAIDQQSAAKSWWLPEIYAGFRAHQLNGRVMNDDGRFFLDVNRQNVWAGAGLMFDLDLGSGIYQNQMAKTYTKAQRFKGENAKNELMLQAVQLYFELQAAQFELAAMEELSTQLERIVKQLEVQTQAGLTYNSELLLTRSNFHHHEIKRLKSQQALVKASIQIKALLNITEIGLLIAQEVIAPVDLVENTATIQQNLDNHPSVQYANYQRIVLEKEQNIYGKGLGLPHIQLGLSDGIFGDIVSPTGVNNNEIDNFNNSFDFTGAVQWRIPLAQVFGKSEKNVIDAKITLQQLQTQQLKETINGQIEMARSAILLTQEQLNFATLSIDMAKEALDQCLERQQLPMVQPYEVFNAQEIFLRAQLDYIEAIKLYNQAQYAFYVALGNGLN